MGDPLHSQPAAVVYGGTPASPDVVVFTATNDGYVHAIDGDTGEELWAFIPKEHLMKLTKLFFNPDSSFKNYGVDGDIVPVVKDVDRDGVIEAADGQQALDLAARHAGAIDLVVTDVVMPEMNGREMADRLLNIRPDMKHLFMSGYTADVIAHRGVLDEGVNFIQKPFSLRDVSAKVREALDE